MIFSHWVTSLTWLAKFINPVYVVYFIFFFFNFIRNHIIPGPIGQLVACLIEDLGVLRSILVRFIDNDIFSTGILLPLIQESMCTKYCLTV